LRCRRTVLTGKRVNDLARTSVLNRYAEWQQLAEEHRWPELLIVQRDDEPGLLIHRSSPLALEAVFKGVRDHVSSLIIEELPGTPRLVGADGGHYMAELSLPFVRRTHCWSSRACSQPDIGADAGREPELWQPGDERVSE
jgi:hypothetical protein